MAYVRRQRKYAARFGVIKGLQREVQYIAMNYIQKILFTKPKVTGF